MSMLKNTLKVTGAGATIFGIAMLFAIQAPDQEIGEVQEAEADIGWFNAGSDGHEFTRAIAAAGLEPRPYDFNGNRMYFAAASADGKPDDIERTMQDIFVEKGVNKRDHYGKPTIPEISLSDVNAIGKGTKKDAHALQDSVAQPYEDLMAGDVMTMHRSADYVAMVGYDWKLNGDEVAAGVADGSLNKRNLNPAELASGYKFLDATYEPSTDTSSVTSVWTGKDFDGKRMTNDTHETRPPDKTVPACPGCLESNYRMESLSPNEPYVANQWTTIASPKDAARYYRQAMANRGWEETGSQKNIDKVAAKLPSVAAIQGSMLQFEKEGQMLHIALVPNGRGGTEIMTTERHQGAKSLLKSVDKKETKSLSLNPFD